jgi:hypothetical protein
MEISGRFANRQLKMKWMTVPPRLTKLGAKWVEVTKTAGTTFLTTYERIENVASNTR